MSHPNITRDTARPNKQYSILHVLDNIATSSADFTLAPAFATSGPNRCQNLDDACKRLSRTLQTLTTEECCRKHLPEIPVPSYDNGTIDISLNSCSQPSLDVVSGHASLKASESTPQESKLCPHLHLASLGQTFNADTFGEMTHLREHILQKSRPGSMYSTSTMRQVTVHKRPGSTGSAARPGRARKRSVAYDDQRACRPIMRHPLKHTSSPCLQTRRRGLQLVASLKDWRTKSDKKRRLEDAQATEQEEEHSTIPMLSLKEALQGVTPLSPLHDPQQDQQFAQECSKLLSLRQDPSNFSFIGSPRTKPPTGPPREMSCNSSQVAARPSMHAHRASEALSISTSILDIEWPQPGGYKTLPSDLTTDLQPARPESPPMPHHAVDDGALERSSPLISLAESPHLDSFPKLWTAPIVEKRTPRSPPPSAPPDRPLPRLPLTEIKTNEKQILKSAETGRRPILEDSPQFRGMSSSDTCRPDLAQSRLSSLAASKGLKVISSVGPRVDTLSHVTKERPATAPSTPLNLRLKKSNRSSRVNEIKRRHVSMLLKDGGNVVGFGRSGVDTVDFARRGSASDAMQTASVHNPHTMILPTRNRRMSMDKYETLPSTPGSKAHPAKCSVSSTPSRQQVSSYVRSSRVNSPTKRNIQLSSGPSSNPSKPEQMLSQSKVMTLVDTDPRASHGFRAGAASPVLGSTFERLPRKGSRATRLTRTESPSSDGSRPSSCQSSMQCWSPKSETTATTATTATTVPSSPNSASFSTGMPLVVSFDSGYASGRENKPTGTDGPQCNAPNLEFVSAKSHQLVQQEQTTSPRSAGLSSKADSEQEVTEFKDEIDHMERVYNAMLRARQGLAQEYMNNKRQAEMLEDEWAFRTASVRFQTGSVLEKIEADPASSRAKTEGDSEGATTLSSLRKPFMAISSATTRKGDAKDDVDDPVSVHGPDVLASSRTLSKSYSAPMGSPSIMSISIESPAQLPSKAGSTLPSTSRRPTQLTASRSRSLMPVSPVKRVSVLSQCNTYSSPPRSPSTSVSAPTPATVPGSLPKKQVAICTRTPAQDMDEEIGFDNAVPPFLTNTRQMDRAIDAFKVSSERDRDCDGISEDEHGYEDTGSGTGAGIVSLRLTDGQFRVM